MTVFSRPCLAVAAAIVSLTAASPGNAAVPVAKPGAREASAGLVKVNDRYDGRYHRRHYRDRNVVHAPFTRVESGRRTEVDAPFVHVHQGRHGTHVVAPFVNYWD
jgi:hypothetical protein